MRLQLLVSADDTMTLLPAVVQCCTVQHTLSKLLPVATDPDPALQLFDSKRGSRARPSPRWASRSRERAVGGRALVAEPVADDARAFGIPGRSFLAAVRVASSRAAGR